MSSKADVYPASGTQPVFKIACLTASSCETGGRLVDTVELFRVATSLRVCSRIHFSWGNDGLIIEVAYAFFIVLILDNRMEKKGFYEAGGNKS